MKKITAIIAVLAVASVMAFAGCQKHEAQQPAVEPAAAPATEMTSTTTTTQAEPAPAAAPEHK